jgi:hypothetical protein
LKLIYQKKGKKMEAWKLFIDDERFPAEDGFVIARSVAEAQALILKNGCPTYIAFDNDLGEGQPEGYDLAKWLVEMDMDGKVEIPNDFSFYVHSQNSRAMENIPAYLNGYLKFRG